MKINRLPVSVATTGSDRPIISLTVLSSQLTASLASAAIIESAAHIFEPD
jgi:hypothetical protein